MKAGEHTGRNLRDVWTIPTQPYPGAHFATFPRKLVEPCLKAGTSERGCCPECGGPWRRVVERSRRYDHVTSSAGKSKAGPYASQTGEGEGAHDIRHGVFADVTTTGWTPTCDHDLPPVPCTVLDPFGGSGTVAEVAADMHLDCILIELSEEYVKLAKKRNEQPTLPFSAAP